MNKVVLATLSFVSGATLGFVVGYYLNKKETEYVEPVYIEPKKIEKPESEKSLDEKISKTFPTDEIKPMKRATHPGEVGINYSKLVKDLKYKQETQSPPEDEPEEEGEESDIPVEEELDMSEYEETYEERVERESEEALAHSEEYKKEHAGKIELMTEDDWDTDFPETDYERFDLYYFTESDILTDEEGNHLDEESTIGKKVRQVGWMQSPDELIYVRNHQQEKEFRVFKENCKVEDWF